jgi:2-methylfumaryl-CoA isomerase
VAELVDGDPDCSEQNPMFTMLDQQGAGALLTAGLPLEFSDIDRLPAAPAPMLGQHTEEVLHELLGINAATFGKLHDRGIVGTASPRG